MGEYFSGYNLDKEFFWVFFNGIVFFFLFCFLFKSSGARELGDVKSCVFKSILLFLVVSVNSL